MFFTVDRQSKTSIQEQLRTKIVAAILDGQLMSGSLLPSTRELSKKLRVSRTTIVLVYEKLVEDGFLASQNRSGFRVASSFATHKLDQARQRPIPPLNTKAVNWPKRFAISPAAQRNISKPADWQKFRYPFVYGQPDPSLFPLAAWRECSRQAMSELAMRNWSSDAVTEDEPHLVNEIKTKLLPRRGIYAEDKEILITAGAQNGLFLIASLLMSQQSTVAVEEPGYPDARNIFLLQGAKLLPLDLDREGAKIDENAQGAEYIFLTPSHHSPTTVTMSDERRKAFLTLASEQDKIIVEDDFESEMNYLGAPVPAMKAEDNEGRVIYLGSLSKSMFPGLRLGYIVASSELIAELRALRRLMLRHVPSNNQRTTALFIAQGFHDSYVRKLNRVYSERSRIMNDSLQAYLPDMSTQPTFGGTSYWVRGPAGLDAGQLAVSALKKSIVIEPGAPHFLYPEGNKHFFRLGFSSIPTVRIDEGIRLLATML